MMENTPVMGDFCWNELATFNVQAAKDFYGKVFGWEFSDHEVGDMTYTMINLNNKQIGGIWTIPKDKEKQIPPHWMTYILVESVEKSVNQAEKLGATIIKSNIQVGDFGRMAVITDPTGAHVALWEPINKK